MKLIEIGRTGEVNTTIVLSDNALEFIKFITTLYQKQKFLKPWIGYIAIKRSNVVGACVFKSAAENEMVEIAYLTFPEYVGRGIATQMASELIQISKNSGQVNIVFAQTLPEESASTAILKKLGFSHTSNVAHLEDGLVWQWELELETMK